MLPYHGKVVCLHLLYLCNDESIKTLFIRNLYCPYSGNCGIGGGSTPCCVWEMRTGIFIAVA